jgi:hypothetical protein
VKNSKFNCSKEFFDSNDSKSACFCDVPSKFGEGGLCDNKGIDTYIGCYADTETDRDF